MMAAFEWAGSLLVLASILLYPRRLLAGCVVGIVGSACWIVVGLDASLPGLIILNAVIALVHLHNLERNR